MNVTGPFAKLWNLLLPENVVIVQSSSNCPGEFKKCPHCIKENSAFGLGKIYVKISKIYVKISKIGKIYVNYFLSITQQCYGPLADPDLQIRGWGLRSDHPDPEIRGGGGEKKFWGALLALF